MNTPHQHEKNSLFVERYGRSSMSVPQSLITWQLACEESQRRAEELRKLPAPYYRELAKMGFLILGILALFIGLLFVAAVLGAHR